MANLRKCSRCKSEIDISYFGMSRKKEPYKTCDNCRDKKKQTQSNCASIHSNITTKEIEQMNKIKVKQIYECIESNADNNDDTCPTCSQGGYKKHIPCSLPPDCMLCYKWVCTRCGILDNVNSAEANGYLCVHCYNPSLIDVDYG